MSDARDGFDAIGVVVDWIDALSSVGWMICFLYDATTTVECCEGGSLEADLKWKGTGVRGWREQ